MPETRRAWLACLCLTMLGCAGVPPLEGRTIASTSSQSTILSLTPGFARGYHALYVQESSWNWARATVSGPGGPYIADASSTGGATRTVNFLLRPLPASDTPVYNLQVELFDGTPGDPAHSTRLGTVTYPSLSLMPGVNTLATAGTFSADASGQATVSMGKPSVPTYVGTIAGSDTASSLALNTPGGLVYDSVGKYLFIADTNNNVIKRLPYSSGGSWGTLTSVAGSGTAGSTDGTGTGASFDHPLWIGQHNTTLFVCEAFTGRIRTIDLTASPVAVGTLTNTGGAAITLDTPKGLVVTDVAGRADLYAVCAGSTNAIVHITLDVLGKGTLSTVQSGLSSPRGLALSGTTLYVGLGGSTVATLPTGGGAPTSLATGFSGMQSLAIDGVGRVLVTDGTSQLVKLIDTQAGNTLRVLAGGSTNTGAPGFPDGFGTAAAFTSPLGILSIPSVGTVVSAGHRIRWLH